MENYDLYDLPDNILFKSNESFYDFVEQVTGKIEADILRVQGIRNARCLIRANNLLAILELDCDEVNELKPHACFQCSTGDFIIKQGVQLNLDNLTDALKDKHEKYKKKNLQYQRQHVSPSPALVPSTPSTDLNNNDSSTVQDSTVDITMSNSSNAYLVSTSAGSSASKYKTINDHVIFIKDLIEKFSRKSFTSVILKQNEHYDLMVTKDGQAFKAIVKCQCGAKIMLPTRSDTSTFILSNFYAHLTTSNCSMVDRIFKEQENALTEQLEAPSSSNSVPPPISASTIDVTGSKRQTKRKHLYNISSVTMPSSNKKKKQKKTN